MKPMYVLYAAILLCFSLAVRADDATSGPHGGQIKHSGKYHMELVVRDATLTVYLTGDKDARVATKGASGSATVLSGKTTVSVKLAPSGENALAGSGGFKPAPDMKVVVSVALPGQPPAQARFTPLEKPKPLAKTPAK